MVDFIGLGAQKAGTSWLYACLYEHPEICAPQKELHFFSRPRYGQGTEWYESQFARCPQDTKRGEFSTSYLSSKETPSRIAAHYPDAKLIAIVRNPIDRAYSQYRNAIKAGEIETSMTFREYLKAEPSAAGQGRYHEQLMRYHKHLNPANLLVLVYEDSKQDPAAFVRRVYEHLAVDPTFTPSMLTSEINTARTPRSTLLDRVMHTVAETLRRTGFDKLVWRIKQSGLTDRIRAVNTSAAPVSEIDPETEAELRRELHADVQQLSDLLQRDLVTEWGFTDVTNKA